MKHKRRRNRVRDLQRTNRRIRIPLSAQPVEHHLLLLVAEGTDAGQLRRAVNHPCRDLLQLDMAARRACVLTCVCGLGLRRQHVQHARHQRRRDSRLAARRQKSSPIHSLGRHAFLQINRSTAPDSIPPTRSSQKFLQHFAFSLDIFPYRNVMLSPWHEPPQPPTPSTPSPSRGAARSSSFSLPMSARSATSLPASASISPRSRSISACCTTWAWCACAARDAKSFTA